MGLFLDTAELRTLTGRARKRDQVTWLRTSGIPFHVNAAGCPIVARAYFTREPVAAANAPAWAPAPARREA